MSWLLIFFLKRNDFWDAEKWLVCLQFNNLLYFIFQNKCFKRGCLLAWMTWMSPVWEGNSCEFGVLDENAMMNMGRGSVAAESCDPVQLGAGSRFWGESQGTELWELGDALPCWFLRSSGRSSVPESLWNAGLLDVLHAATDMLSFKKLHLLKFPFLCTLGISGPEIPIWMLVWYRILLSSGTCLLWNLTCCFFCH